MAARKNMVVLPAAIVGVILLGLLLWQGGLIGGSEGEMHGADSHSDEEDQADHEDELVVELHAEEMKEFGVVVETAGPVELHIQLDVSGEVVVNADRQAHITPRSAGIVRRVEKTLGDPVAPGDVLAVLESPELGEAKVSYLTARQQIDLARTDRDRAKTVRDNTLALLELLQSSPDVERLMKFEGRPMGENRSLLVAAYADVAAAKATFEREKRLFEGKIGSESDYLTAESDYKRAGAAYVAARDTARFEVDRALLETERAHRVAELGLTSADRRLHLLGLNAAEIQALEKGDEPHEQLAFYSLRAPFEGVVIEKHITLGERLGDDAIAFTIADLRLKWVDLTIYQKDLEMVTPGQSASLRAASGRTVVGKIGYISPHVDEATRTAIARVVLEDSEGAWRPGVFVTASIAIRSVHANIVVPRSAVQTIGDEPAVFVKSDHGFEVRHVEIGRADTEHIEIVSGLETGESFVSRGAFVLKAELGKASFGDGHGH